MCRLKFLLFVLVLSIVVSVAHAQDPVTVDPSIVKVEFENNRIRVLRVHYGPHQKLAMHEHPAKVAVCLTNFHMHRVASDGTSSEGTCPTGSVSWREPEKHAVENLDAAAETIEIELKYAQKPAVAPAPNATAAGSEPVPANLEPHHHAVFENQYVRVMDVQIAPGESTLYHTHSHDTVYVRLSDSQTLSQTQGMGWSLTRVLKSGEFAFDEDARHPLTHRVKNVGTTPYRVLAIELLP